MYALTEEQRNSLLYIFDHLAVTGPIQGGLLNNAAGIVQSLKKQPTAAEEKKEEK